MDDQLMAVNKTMNVNVPSSGVSKTDIFLIGSENVTLRNVFLWKDANIFSGTLDMILNLRSQLGQTLNQFEPEYLLQYSTSGQLPED